MSERRGGGLMRVCLLLLMASVVAGWGAGGALASPAIWGSPGSGDGQFSDPWDVAVAPDGDVYVADRGNHRIQHFSEEGEYIGQWGSPGTEPGQFGDDLVGVAVSPTGKVFALDMVTDGGTRLRVQRFDADGAFEAGWGTAAGSAIGEFDHPSDIAVGPTGRVYVVETANRRVQSFDSDGSSPSAWGTSGGGGEGEFSEPVGIAVDQDSGNVYVADAGGTARVQEFSPTGVFVTQWGSTGSGEGQFRPDGLVGIAVGADGSVYTREEEPLDQGGSRFQRFTSSGEFVGMYRWLDSEEPRGLAVAGNALYAPDTGGGRLQVFDLSTPEVSLLAPYTPIAAGREAVFDATASVPLGQIVDYEWDLDGDGLYELDSGTVSRATHVYDVPGQITVGLRVRSDRGGTAVDHREVNVVLGPPPGPVGVSINGGARFTRDPRVKVTIRWPVGATSLLISNDGGFTPSTQMPVAATIPWRLDSSGPERLPKTIYVRFSGGSSGPETYQDDIILDETAPAIRFAALTAGGRGQPRLHLKARDNASGVAFVQLTGRGGRPARWRRFAGLIRLRGPVRGLHVRVRDNAGNRSRWHRVAQACRACP